MRVDPFQGLKAMEDRAGAKRMQDNKFARRGEIEPAVVPISMEIRAESGGRWRMGGNAFTDTMDGCMPSGLISITLQLQNSAVATYPGVPIHSLSPKNVWWFSLSLHPPQTDSLYGT